MQSFVHNGHMGGRLPRPMRRLVALLTFLFASVALGGCLSNDETTEQAVSDPSGLDRLSVEAWKSLLSEPVFDGVTETTVGVTAEDGAHLSLTLYLPEGLPADAKVPTLLELTPYQTLDRGLNALATEPNAGGGWQEMVLRGMAFVRADARGTHGSEGCLDFGGEIDRSDARVFMQWIRDQPWSDGRVVTDGVSHPGMGSVVAHVADTELTAAIATAPVVSYYMDEWFQGAKYDNQLNGPAYQAIELLPATSTAPEDHAAQAAPCTGKTTTDYGVDGTWGPLWQERDLALTMERALAEGSDHAAPILINHGFVDLNVQPDHAQIYWDALPDDYPKSLVMGWWYHSWPDLDGHPAESYADVRQRFFDHFLLGMDNGWEHEPRVLVEDSTGAWHESHDWPLDGSTRATFWAVDEDGLGEAPGEVASATFADPLPQDQDDPSGQVLFRGEPVAAPVLVNGQPVVELVASSSEAQTKWVVFLLDEAPDGSLERISHGATDSRRLHERDEGWADLVPGEPETWTMKLLPTAYVLEEGHRLVLEVSSQESNRLREQSRCWDDHRGGNYCPNGILPATSAGQAVNTVVTGPEGTRVYLDLADPLATAIEGPA